METNERGATHVPPGEGKKLWVTDELMTFIASGEDTGGAYSLTDSMVPPQGGPPPHIHHREAEAFWVLEGELEVFVGENRFKVVAGSFVPPPQRRTPLLPERRHRARPIPDVDGPGWVVEVLRGSRQAGHGPVFPAAVRRRGHR
jgi:mannose-6-phosphate isomerase-like protein (cupin superfamily)